MAFFSLKVSDKLVMRLGIRLPLAVGVGLVAVSLALSPKLRSTAATRCTSSPA